MFKRIFMIIIAMFLISNFAFAGDKKIIVGTSADYPPWEWKDANGNFVGFDMDVMRMIANISGFEIEIKDIPFDALITSLKAGQIDVIASGLSISEERAKVVDFTDPYYDADTGIMVKDDSKLNVTNLFLKGRKIGAQLGGVQGKWLEEQVKAGAQFELKMYETNDLAIMDIKAGRLDALLTDVSGANAFASVAPVRVVGIIVTGAKVGMAIQKGDPKGLLIKINSGFQKLQEMGVWDELLAAYFLGDLKKITECYGTAKGFMEKGDSVNYVKKLKKCMTE